MAEPPPAEAWFHFLTRVEVDATGVSMIHAMLAFPEWFTSRLPPGFPGNFDMGTLPLKVAQTNRQLWVEWVKLMARCVEHMVFDSLGEKIVLDVDAALRAQRLDG